MEPLGRQQEITAAQASIDLAVRSGMPAAVEISGEPGIGKSTVLDALVTRSRSAGIGVWRCGPTASERSLPWSALRLMLEHRQSFPDGLPAALSRLVDGRRIPRAGRNGEDGDAGDESEADASTIAFEFADVVRASAAAGLVILLDDAMWIDQASAPAITTAMRVPAPIAWIVARRTTERPPIDLARLFPADRRRAIELDGLGFRATGDLLAAVDPRHWTLPEIRRLHRLTGGHPLFLTEMARQPNADEHGLPDRVSTSVPASIIDLYADRLGALDPETRDVLATAALARRPTVGLLDRLHRGVSQALETAEHRGLVRISRAGEVEFRHALVAHALLDMQGTMARRRQLLALAAMVDDRAEAAEYLAAAADEPDAQIAADLEIAAGEHLNQAAVDRAAELFARAAELTPVGLPDDARRRRIRAIDAAVHAGAWPEAIAQSSELIEVLPADLYGPTAIDHLICLDRLYGRDAAVTFARVAVERLRGRPERARLQLLLVRLLQGDDIQQAEDAAVAALGWDPTERSADGVDELSLRAAELQCRVIAGREPRPGEAIRALAERIEDWRGGGLQDAIGYVGELMSFTDQLDECRAAYTEQAASARRRGHHSRLSAALDILAEVEYRAGRWAEARALLTESVALVDAFGAEGDRLTRARLMRIEVFSGVPTAEADRFTDDLLAHRHDDVSIYRLQMLVYLGQVNLVLGRLPAAVGLFVEADTLAERVGVRNPQVLPFLADLAHSLVLSGDVVAARSVATRLAEQSKEHESADARADSARAAALVDAAAGHPVAARQRFDDSVILAAEAIRPLTRAVCELERASFLRRQKARGDARGGLERALAMFTELGAVPFVKRCEFELQRLGRGATDTELTPSEARIADLAAAGRSNRQIADEMIVSLRTVESTLTRVYRKLGVRSRTEMLALLTHR